MKAPSTGRSSPTELSRQSKGGQEKCGHQILYADRLNVLPARNDNLLNSCRAFAEARDSARSLLGAARWVPGHIGLTSSTSRNMPRGGTSLNCNTPKTNRWTARARRFC